MYLYLTTRRKDQHSRYSDWAQDSMIRGSNPGRSKLYDDMMYLLTAIGQPPGGGSTVHIYTQTIQRTTENKQYIQQHKNWKEFGPCPVFGGFTLAFALQLRKKHGKTSKSFRQALGTIQAPMQCVGSFVGCTDGDVNLTIILHQLPRLRTAGSITLFPLYTSIMWTGT